MKFDPVNRRMFLQGAGVALAIPLLPSLFKRGSLYAQSASSPKRLIFMAMRNGSLAQDSWFPSSSPTTQKAWVAGHSIYDDPLSNFIQSGRLSPALTPAITAFSSKMNLINGLSHPMYLGHHSGGLLGNMSASDQVEQSFVTARPTIDRLIGRSSSFYPDSYGGKKYINWSDDGGSMLWDYSDPNNPNPASVQKAISWGDVRDLFTYLFGVPGSVDSSDAEVLEKVKLVDKVLVDYNSLLSNSRLGSSDKQKVQQVMDHLNDIENQLNNGLNNSCDGFVAPSSNGSLQGGSRHQLLNQIISLAFQCDASRIATLKLDAVNGINAANASNPESSHYWSHNSDLASSQSKLLEMHQFYANEILADLLARLDVEESDGRTYLDNSLIVKMDENSATHWNANNMCMTFGGFGGGVRTGRYLDYTNRNFGPMVSGSDLDPIFSKFFQSGILINKFWATLLELGGVNAPNYMYGDTYNSASVSGSGWSASQNRRWRDNNFQSSLNNSGPLPYFLNS